MIFGKKKNSDEELVANSLLIEKNAAQISFLKSLLVSQEGLADKLDEAQIRIKYFTPTLDKSAVSIDKKIESRLGDIKIALSKAKNSSNYSYAAELIDGLVLLVAERKSILA